MLAELFQGLTNPKFPTQDVHTFIEEMVPTKQNEMHHHNYARLQHNKHSREDATLTSTAENRKTFKSLIHFLITKLLQKL